MRIRCFTICCVACLTYFACAHVLATEPPLLDLSIAPDGKSVVAISQSGIHIHGWPSLERRQTIASTNANLHCLEFSPDGQRLAVGGGDPSELGSVEVFSWPACERLQEFDGHSDSVRDLAWFDDETLLSVSMDRAIHQHSFLLQDGPTLVLQGHSRSVDAVCLIPKSSIIVSAGADQSLRVWDIEKERLVRSLNQHTARVNCLALRPGGAKLPMVASAAEDHTVRFWQPTIGRMVRYVRLDSKPLALVWTQDGSHILAACVDGQVHVIDPEAVKVIVKLSALPSWAYALARHPLEPYIVAGGWTASSYVSS